MSGGLVIRLRPHEKFLINGVVLENGERRAKLRIKSQDANVLRMRDALHPTEATTPVKRVYYKAQLVVTGDADADASVAGLLTSLAGLHEAFPDGDCRATVERAQAHVHAGEFYQVMKAMKTLMPIEEKLLLIARAKNLAPTTHATQ